MAAETPPPADFLFGLRKRGIRVGLGKQQLLARLATCWEGEDLEEFKNAVAALLSTSAEEVATVKEVFDRTWHAAFGLEYDKDRGKGMDLAAQGQGTNAAPRLRTRSRRERLRVHARLYLLGVLCVLLCADPRPPVRPPARTASARMAEEVRVPLHRPKTVVPVCSPDNLPPPTVIRYYRGPVAATVLLCAALFLWLNVLRSRRRFVLATRRYWSERLEGVEGPRLYGLALPELRSAIPKEDLDEMATILGRLKSTSRDLDVPRTIDRTLRAGLLLLPVYRSRPMGATILILQDIGYEMRPWARKVDDLFFGLLHIGVPVERWFFEGDASWVMGKPAGRLQPLSDLANLHGPTPLLVISTGGGFFDEAAGEPRRCVHDLERLFPVRTLLHPAADPKRWRPFLRRWHGDHRAPMTVRPMTRAGMRQAACELAHFDEGFVPKEGRRPVSQADLDRMRELLAIAEISSAGGPGREVAELLRQRFAADVPDEVVLHLMALGADVSGACLRFAPEEVSRSLRAGRRRFGLLGEEQVRRYLLRLLRGSRPEDRGSVAHLRWRLDCAAQEMYVPDPQLQEHALSEFRELLQGPLWQEVDAVLRRISAPGLQRPAARTLPMGRAPDQKLRAEFYDLLRERERAGGPREEGLSQAPRPTLLTVPGAQEIAATALLGACCFGLIADLGLIPREEVPHVQQAYRIRREAETPQALFVEPGRAMKAGLPELVDLYRDRDPKPLRTRIALRRGAPALDLPEQDPERSHCYHVRALLPRGNYALSGQLFVAGARTEPQSGRLLVSFVSGRTRKDLGPVPFRLDSGLGETAHGRGGEELKLLAGLWTLESAGIDGGAGALLRTLNVEPDRLTREQIVVGDYATVEIAEVPDGVAQDQVLVNGVAWNGKEVRVQPGRVLITLEHPYFDERLELAAAAGEKKTVKIFARPRFGVLELLVNPPKARLEARALEVLEERPTEGGQLYRLRGEDGSYRVEASAPAYLRGEAVVAIVPGETVLSQLSLAPVPAQPLPAPGEIMVRVPGGAINLGESEGRPRLVSLSPFLFDKIEVTVAAYRSCVEAGSCSVPASDSRYCNYEQAAHHDHPVNCVSHVQARAFCAWAGKRLPTEAEWELSARGPDGGAYPWGEDAPGEGVCWRRYPGKGTCPVGSFSRDQSPFGILDMAGNVAEWTADRTVKGGSWFSSSKTSLLASARRREQPAEHNSELGFRCAKGLPQGR